jgi:hypothetical protein
MTRTQRRDPKTYRRSGGRSSPGHTRFARPDGSAPRPCVGRVPKQPSELAGSMAASFLVAPRAQSRPRAQKEHSMTSHPHRAASSPDPESFKPPPRAVENDWAPSSRAARRPTRRRRTQRALEISEALPPAGLVTMVIESGLRGRGGAGFPPAASGRALPPTPPVDNRRQSSSSAPRVSPALSRTAAFSAGALTR